jgi:protein tyrosine phosphatase (PTP) superfamily phosphohydrolase (DUF442 family)
MAPAFAAQLSAPNVVEITPHLITSGQPTAASLADLGAMGFEAEINLNPPAAMGNVKDEATIVGKQRLIYVSIPIDFRNPSEQDFNTFAAELKKLGDRKVLVHCQVNMRASSMVFLYRVIVNKEDPQLAYKSVAQVWAPEGPWKRLIQDLLKKNNVNFELY